jgi:hypothetical protein
LLDFSEEKGAFVRWVFRSHLLESIYFYVKIISKKIITSLHISTTRKYPYTVKQYLHYNYQLNNNKVFLKPFDFKKVNTLDVGSINLAGSELEIHRNSIDWSKEWDDTEDEESLHRWNWSIDKLSTIPSKEKSNLAAWVQGQQEDWVDKYQVEIIKDKTDGKLRWESYTVGERISNSSIFFHLTLGGWSSAKLSNAIQEQVVYLIHHLEYFGEDTGNHVVNNARAIYLAGVSFDCPEWKELALIIFENGVPIVVTEDGFLREGSSHYQFLFTRWLLEIYYFASIAEDEKMKEFLYPYLQLLLKQCYFFLVYNQSEEQWNMPLFGDISPDFPPEWLLYLPWSTLATHLVAPPSQKKVDSQDCWNQLWSQANLQCLDTRINKEPHNQNCTLTYPESGWFRIECGEFTLFYRMDRDTAPDYVGHHHQDLYHFCLYKNGTPIFVDSGRKNYGQAIGTWGQFGLSPQAHNSVTIDGIGSLPEKPYRYPKKYSNSKNSSIIESYDDCVTITLESTCFKRLIKPATLIRKIILNTNSMRIEDQFRGAGEHDITTYFHFSSNADLQYTDSNDWQVQSGEISGKFKIEFTEKSNITHHRGDDSPLGWVVSAYGRVKNSSTLSIDCKVQLPATLKYGLFFG